MFQILSRQPSHRNAEIHRQQNRKWEIKKGQIKNIIANDVARKYFHASSRSSVFLELSQEDRRPEEETMRGELSVSMYGTRSPVRNSQTCYTNVPCNCVFRVARGNTCIFRRQERDNVVMVHGDDFVSTADTVDRALVGKHAQGEVRNHNRHCRTRWRRIKSRC